MLEAALQHVSRLEVPARAKFRYVQVSTDEVYGTLGDVGAFDEQSPYKPNSPYSACKAAGDHLAWAWFATYQLPVVISNCSNNYGPYQHPEKLIPTVIRNALVDAPIPVYGDGRNRRDWLHVDDHVDGLLKAVAAGRPGDKFGFGGGGDIANIDLVQRICRILDRLRPRPDGRSRDSQIRFVDDRPGHDFRYAIDCQKAQKELGWRPRRSIDEGLEETVAWYLGNSDWLVRATRGADAPRPRQDGTGVSKAWKGMVLAGGSGTRLYPLTLAVSKQLLPVYDKPMIYYPLSTLMLAGIRDILMISTPHDMRQLPAPAGRRQPARASRISYAVQPKPGGLAQAFLIGARVRRPAPTCALILGDNIFYGQGSQAHARRSAAQRATARRSSPTRCRTPSATASSSSTPSGRAVCDRGEAARSRSRTTPSPGSTSTTTRSSTIAASLKPSARGELEITDVNRAYLKRGQLHVERLGRGFAWLDTGTHDIAAPGRELRRDDRGAAGLKIACIEEVAYRMGYIGGRAGKDRGRHAEG